MNTAADVRLLSRASPMMKFVNIKPISFLSFSSNRVLFNPFICVNCNLDPFLYHYISGGNDLNVLAGFSWMKCYVTVAFIFQEGSICFVKTDGLKRGLQSMESSDYPMGEIISGNHLPGCII